MIGEVKTVNEVRGEAGCLSLTAPFSLPYLSPPIYVYYVGYCVVTFTHCVLRTFVCIMSQLFHDNAKFLQIASNDF